MANIALKDITFPGLSNVYEIPEVDNTLSEAGAAADAKKTGDELGALKEDIHQLTDVMPSLNLLDINALTNGYLRDSGSITVSGDWKTTDFIPVEYGKTYRPSYTNQNTRKPWAIYFRLEYDESKTKIADTYGTDAITSYTPLSESAKYVRFSFELKNTGSERCFVEGLDIKYYPYGDTTTIKEDVNSNDVVSVVDSVDVVHTRNLFDKNAINAGYISNKSGAITYSADWYFSDFIPVEYGKTYYASNANGREGIYFVQECGENKDGLYYTASPSTLYFTPQSSSVKYVRFCIGSAIDVDTFVFEENTQASSIFTPYGKTINPPYKSVLYGKKWVAVGDSLTEKNVSAISNYTDFITVLNNMELVNKGTGGTGYMRGYDTSNAFYQRVANLPDCDIITIFGSGNDLAYYSDLGDVTDTGTATICGCINETLDVIFENHPTTPLLVIAPTPWAGNTPDMATGMAVYCEKLEAICARRGIAYLDLFHHSGLRPDDSTQNELVFYDGTLDGHSDYVHPNKLGHSIIAPRIMKAMETVMIF